MRKYYKLISLVLLIVCTIAVFYTTISFGVKQLPQFEIHTVSGNEEDVEPVVIQGILGTNSYNEDTFKFENGITTFSRYQSIINQTDMFNDNEVITNLQKRYRNFMRGKGYHKEAFYENNEYVIYGNVAYDSSRQGGDYKFEIEVLNKQTKEVISSFTHAIPNRSDYWSLELAHVQLHDDQLKIITFNDFIDGDKLQEARLYTFDIHEKKLVSDEQIFELERNKKHDGHGYMGMINNENKEDAQIAIYSERIDLILEDEEIESYSEKKAEKMVAIYDLTDQSISKINLNKDIDNIGIPIYIEDQALYFGKVLINKLEITKYDIKKQQVEQEMDVNINVVNVERDNLYNATIIDGKLYYIPTHSSELTIEPSIVIIDLKEMKTIYEGYLKLKDGEITRDTYLYLQSLEVK